MLSEYDLENSECSYDVCTTNQTIVLLTVINVKPSLNFEELLVQIKSGVFSAILASLELPSSILDPGKTNLLKFKSL